MFRHFKAFSLSLAFCLAPLAVQAGVKYSVEFEGLDDDKALKAIKSVSSLTALKKRPPASINALRYRAESDIPDLLKVLQAHGYYEAEIQIRVHEISGKVEVVVLITPGPLYQLEEYNIRLYCEDPDQPTQCCHIGLDQIGVRLKRPVRSKSIIDAELKLLEALSECGYPLAVVENREVIADGKTKTVRVFVAVKTGQRADFGSSTIVGNTKVKPLYIEQKTAWVEGAPYDSNLVEETQTTLMDSGLFSSVYITHEEQLNTSGQLPMKIEVSETKHNSINIGVSYQTVFGPGLTFGWENRNIGGMGRRLSFQGDITRISHTGIATYFHPDFKRIGQDYIWQGQAEHESLFAYSMRSYSLMNRFDRKFSKRLQGAAGIKGERLLVTASIQNGNYWLLEVPIYLRWSTANDLLNPTKGVTVEFTTTPSINFGDTRDYYVVLEASESTYLPLNRKHTVVFAQQVTLGRIFSPHLKNVPLSKRFLGGSEQDLRGYRYRTVSPLVDDKPIGGRSAIFMTFELRFRISPSIGLVPFLDLGDVYTQQFPTWHGKWYKSVGLGLRYFSFMGPFRLDVGFPLDRRSGIDSAYRILVSIGQTF